MAVILTNEGTFSRKLPMKFLKILLVRSWLLRIVLSHILASYATTAAWLYIGFFMDWFTLDSQCVYTLLQAPLYLPHCLEVIPKPLKSALPVLKTPFCIGFGIGSSHMAICECFFLTISMSSCSKPAPVSTWHPISWGLENSTPQNKVIHPLHRNGDSKHFSQKNVPCTWHCRYHSTMFFRLNHKCV